MSRPESELRFLLIVILIVILIGPILITITRMITIRSKCLAWTRLHLLHRGSALSHNCATLLGIQLLCILLACFSTARATRRTSKLWRSPEWHLLKQFCQSPQEIACLFNIQQPTAGGSEAETGLSQAKAMTEGNGNEFPAEQVKTTALWNRSFRTNIAACASPLTLDIGNSLLDIGCSIPAQEGLK